MRSSRIALAVSFNLVIGFILVLVSHQVNQKSKTNDVQQLHLADGMPLPPLPPANLSSNTTPPPPNSHGALLVADGMPLPPLPPLPPARVNGIAALG